MRAFVAAVLFVLLLGVVGVLAIRGGMSSGARPTEPGPISEANAAAAEAKLGRLLELREEVQLSASELTSLLHLRSDDWSLGLITAPLLRITSDTIHLSGSIDPDQLPSQPDLDAVRLFLPDTTIVQIAGTLAPLDPGWAGVEITSLEIAGMPFPSAYFPFIVDRLGLPADDRLPAGAFAIPLPAGIGSARVSGGQLVLNPLP
jgi:hypothetical protein